MFPVRAAASNYELQMAYSKQMCIFLIQGNVTNTECNIKPHTIYFIFYIFMVKIWLRDRISRRRNFGSIPCRGTRFSLFQSVQTGIGLNLPTAYGQEWLDVKLTTHLQLVSKLLISGAILPVRYTPSWYAHGQPLFLLNLLRYIRYVSRFIVDEYSSVLNKRVCKPCIMYSVVKLLLSKQQIDNRFIDHLNHR